MPKIKIPWQKVLQHWALVQGLNITELNSAGNTGEKINFFKQGCAVRGGGFEMGELSYQTSDQLKIDENPFCKKGSVWILLAGNTKGGSITVLLTSCLTGLG